MKPWIASLIAGSISSIVVFLVVGSLLLLIPGLPMWVGASGLITFFIMGFAIFKRLTRSNT